jgi:uncharacterized damage-inducible protein DinB
MLTSVDAFLGYFETVHRRTVRDVAALPPEAAAWRAPGDLGEGLWSLGEIVGHIAATRTMFVGAFAGGGWHLPGAGADAFDARDQATWVPALESALEWMQWRLANAPAAWLERRVESMDRTARIQGWRVLLLLVEHEVHHRSQLDTYAGLDGWRVPDLFGFSFEQVRELAGPGPSGGAQDAPGGARP